MKARCVASEGGANALFQFCIARLPQLVAGVDSGEVHRAGHEGQDGLARLHSAFRVPHLKHASTFLVVAAVAGIEDNAVTGLQRAVETDMDAVAGHARDFTNEGTALLAKARMHEALIVDAFEPAGGESAAEGHFEFVAFGLVLCLPARLATQLVQRLPVDARDAGDVFGRLEPALNLERSDAGADEVGQDFEAGEVLWGKQVVAAAQLDLASVGD